MQGSGPPGRECGVARCVGRTCMYCLEKVVAMSLIVITGPFFPILGLTDPREVG